MRHSKAEDAGVLSHNKDDNEAVAHFHRFTSLFSSCLTIYTANNPYGLSVHD